jgi:hypothetical protein
MMQIWLHSVPNMTPTLIVGLTFDEIRQLLAKPADMYLPVLSAETAETPELRLPMDVYFMSARTKEDIDKFYAKSKSVAPLHEPVWHTRATTGTASTPIVLIGLSFDDLNKLIDNPLEFLWEIEGERIKVPFNILICGGETKEEMIEWFLKKHSITKAPVH